MPRAYTTSPTREPIDPDKPLNARGWRMDGVIKEPYRKTMGYPRRQAVRYNLAELEQMLAAYDAGASIEEIAADHERSVGGVGGRIEELVERRRKGWPLLRGAAGSPEERQRDLANRLHDAEARVIQLRKSLRDAEGALRTLVQLRDLERTTQ